jgi:hypothetical protein
MSRWKDFEQANPELAAFGKARFQSGVAYLGTIRPDGGPRVHPVTPIIGEDLFLFMEPTSPKGKDLERDGRYSLHCGIEDSSGGGGEFYLRGTASRVTDPLIREKAVQASSYTPNPRYILFVLTVDYAFKNEYIGGTPTIARWEAS